jgi:hypothetical protein
MHLEQRAQQMSPSEVAALLASHRSLEASHEKLEGEVVELKRQLNWFKKQLFGSKGDSAYKRPYVSDESVAAV